MRVVEAAQITARSPDWIRNRIGEGRLTGRQLLPGGPLVVAVPSLIAFIDSTEARDAEREPEPPAWQRRRRASIYMAVNNGA